jgi:hypothetical protein
MLLEAYKPFICELMAVMFNIVIQLGNYSLNGTFILTGACMQYNYCVCIKSFSKQFVQEHSTVIYIEPNAC